MSRTSTCSGMVNKFGGGELQATRATSCSSFCMTSSLAWLRMLSRSTMSESRTVRCLFFHCLVCCCTLILNRTCTVGVNFSLNFSPELAGRCAQSGASLRSVTRCQAWTLLNSASTSTSSCRTACTQPSSTTSSLSHLTSTSLSAKNHIKPWPHHLVCLCFFLCALRTKICAEFA